MNEPNGRVDAATFLAALPAEQNVELFSDIQARVRASARLVIVLDDDPTGTQTVHNVPVLTRWDAALLKTEMQDAQSVLYLLTNSRSVPRDQAYALNQQVGARLMSVARAIGRDIRIISRSDSTLRGHYPAEINALQEALGASGQRVDAHLIIPCFVEGGRLTVNSLHWLREGTDLVPSAETEFARDKDFGYVHSDLREWVAEKTRGDIGAYQVGSIRLEELRSSDGQSLFEKILTLQGPVAVDAVTYRDLEVLVTALLDAEKRGHYFLYRTAASFVRVYGGIGLRDLLSTPELDSPHRGRGGLILAGSYTSTTTRQIERLRADGAVKSISLDVERVLDHKLCASEIQRVCEEADDAIAHGHTTLVYTSRKVVSADSHLEIGKQISDALTRVVRGLKTAPHYVIAKGGITSSNIATDGLGVQRAWVLGQIEPGVPVWRLGAESRFPSMPYIVFPGNVGDDSALARIVSQLQKL